jgi:hypothetical protein
MVDDLARAGDGTAGRGVSSGGKESRGVSSGGKERNLRFRVLGVRFGCKGSPEFVRRSCGGGRV